MPKGWQLGKWLAQKMNYKTRRDGGNPRGRGRLLAGLQILTVIRATP